MADYTKHYNFKKPMQTEGYNVDVANSNNDIIDEKLYEKLDKIPGKSLSTNDFTDGYKKKVDRMVECTRGFNNYEIAVINGFEGTEEEWLATLKGNGITSIQKTSSSGLINTYTITYTDGTTETIDITDGYTPVKGIDYYTTEEKEELQANILDKVNQFSVQVVETLPTENINEHTIYFVPKANNKNQDIYDEYIYINNDFEHIGTTEVDLSNYYNKTETYNKEEIYNKTEIDNITDNLKTLPIGGTTGQVLSKKSDTDYDVEWVNKPENIVVENSLESESTTNALSAKQGKMLKEQIDNINTYSTEEINTGKKWIDGKPLYRRIVVFQLATGKQINLTGLNFQNGFLEWSKLNIGAYIDMLPIPNPSGYTWVQMIKTADGGVTIAVISNDSSINSGIFTGSLLYTKTTD